MKSASQPRITFITGTDTGVGKTLLTALLLCHLRRTGRRALALKPFCSGSRADARLLDRLQESELALDQVNPYYFHEPLAPLVAARKHHRRIGLGEVLSKVRDVVSARRAAPLDHLLIEGSGGLLVPLGEGTLHGPSRQVYTVLDLVSALACEVVVVARNRLGTINHSLLTVRTLQDAGIQHLKIVLMDCRPRDPSCYSNHQVLSQLLAPLPVYEIPFLPAKSRTSDRLSPTASRLGSMLTRLAQPSLPARD